MSWLNFFIRILALLGVALILLGLGTIFFSKGSAIHSPGGTSHGGGMHSTRIMKGRDEESPFKAMGLIAVGGGLIAFAWYREKSDT